MKRIGTAAIAALALAGCDGTGKAKDAVKATMIDPASAEFRDIAKCAGDPTVWRGDVNGKNRMGAYVGFSPFFYDGTTVAMTGDGDDRFMKLMDRCYSNLKTPEEKEKEKADAAAEAAAKVLYGEWSVSEDVNPVDDSKSTYASLNSGDGSTGVGEGVSLTVRCKENKTEVYANWNDYLGDDSHDVYNDWKKVTVRIDAEPAKIERWGISTDKEATFAPSGTALAKRIAKADRLVLQTTPYAESPVTAVFALKGATNALKAVAANCGWTID